MGISGSNTASAVESIRYFSQYQIAGFLLSPPAYVRPSQQGLLLHFEAIANATSHRIILYNIPARIGVSLEIPTLIKLSTNPQFVGIKESSGNKKQIYACLEKTKLKVLSSDDGLLFDTLAHGGIGAISAAAHIHPSLYIEIFNLIQARQLKQAKKIFNSLLPLVRLLSSEPNPGPVKAVLAMQGRIKEDLRLPMTPVYTGHREVLRLAIQLLDLGCYHKRIKLTRE